MKFNLNNRFTQELPADPITENYRRQVRNACFSYAQPRTAPNPQMIHFSQDLLEELGIDPKKMKTDDCLNVFSGKKIIPDTRPYSICYGGHQFGHWAGQLGDGRAINLFEATHQGKTRTFQLKGAGETPYSRNADGLAVLRSSVREHLCSEAMYHLGVPTTRSLCLLLSGENIERDMMYDGNPRWEKGAIICRVAESFIRFGNFEILAARRDLKTLKKLANYTIKHHFPSIEGNSKNAYINLFQAVAEQTLEMIIHWQRIGFVHGVMNTDNMSILGLSIDYGPFGFLDDYNPEWTPNTTDRNTKRYRFDQQPAIAQWNLFQLANALYPLIEEAKPFEEILNNFHRSFHERFILMMRKKLGLQSLQNEDENIIYEMLGNLKQTETDYTIFFRMLSKINIENHKNWQEIFSPSFYQADTLNKEKKRSWETWIERYTHRIKTDMSSEKSRIELMNASNPKYILRNYMFQMAIDQADQGDYSLISELHNLSKQPYNEQPENEKWFKKRPDWARNKIGSSMLSCSS